MADITAADLLVGSDEDFVINLYLACLGRWPDPEGYEHLMAKLAGSAAARAQAITDLTASPEALTRGRQIPVQDPLLPAEPVHALQRQLALRTEYLLSRTQTAAPSVTSAPGGLVEEMSAELAALRRELREASHTPRAELAALRRELREGLAAAAEPRTISLAGPDMADYVNDLLSLAEARMELRLRALEKRLP
jgi:hypothetical protein